MHDCKVADRRTLLSLAGFRPAVVSTALKAAWMASICGCMYKSSGRDMIGTATAATAAGAGVDAVGVILLLLSATTAAVVALTAGVVVLGSDDGGGGSKTHKMSPSLSE